jgi:hypothetical protein
MGILDRVNPFKVSPEAAAAQKAAREAGKKARMEAYKTELTRVSVERARSEAKKRAAWDVLTPQQKVVSRMEAGAGAMRGIARSGMFGMQAAGKIKRVPSKPRKVKTKVVYVTTQKPQGLF